MRIFTEQTLKAYSEKHPEVKTALQEWAMIVKQSKWTCFADNFRLVVLIKFTIQFVYVRFIGTHAEYDKIDCSTI